MNGQHLTPRQTRLRRRMPDTPFDPVQKAAHYNQGGIECIDAIQAALTPEEFRGFLKGQVLKYHWRGPFKGKALQDAEKAQWYGDRLVRVLTKDQ